MDLTQIQDPKEFKDYVIDKLESKGIRPEDVPFPPHLDDIFNILQLDTKTKDDFTLFCGNGEIQAKTSVKDVPEIWNKYHKDKFYICSNYDCVACLFIMIDMWQQSFYCQK